MKRHVFILVGGTSLLFCQDVWAQSQKPTAPLESATEVPASPATKPITQIPNTLMFSIDELNDIQGRIASVGADETSSSDASDKIENATLYLSTILYYGPKDWTIWLNGKPIGPTDEFSEFQVTDIGPRHVELLVPLSAQGMRPVHLEPNQTFIAKSGSVVEGSWKR